MKENKTQSSGKFKKIFSLAWVFFKIGLLTFGGGYAMIPLISRETVENKKWISDQDILDIVAIAESTPGPIAINSATFVGYKVAGTLGSVFATLGTVIPSFVIILIISFFLDNFLEIPLIANAFTGIKVAVGILIVNAGINMFKKMEKNLLPRVIMVCSLVTMFMINIFAWNFSSISMLLIAAVVSLICFVLQDKKKEGKAE